ncbi:hypothetical protein C8J57DRAFT_1726482 [Mycena rebaudengoi]|nr:hypothetical protein C8J57DRAFT_1726482 [Mycena rebaudengoi]
MQIPDLAAQLMPLALTPLAAFIPNAIVRDTALGLSVIYFAGFVVHPNLPSTKMKQLEKRVQDISNIHSILIRELERYDPRATTEASLQLAQIKLSESDLKLKALGVKDIKWNDYFQYLRSLLIHIDECLRDIGNFRNSMLMALESNRQIRYMKDIGQRRSTLDTMFLVQNGSDGYSTVAYNLNGASNPTVGRMMRLRDNPTDSEVFGHTAALHVGSSVRADPV